MTFSNKKIGGLRFVRVGRLSLSFCVVRKATEVSKPIKIIEAPRLRSVATEYGRVLVVV